MDTQSKRMTAQNPLLGPRAKIRRIRRFITIYYSKLYSATNSTIINIIIIKGCPPHKQKPPFLMKSLPRSYAQSARKSAKEATTFRLAGLDDATAAGEEQALLAGVPGVPDPQERVVQLGALHLDDDVVPGGARHVERVAQRLQMEAAVAAPVEKLQHVGHCGG